MAFVPFRLGILFAGKPEDATDHGEPIVVLKKDDTLQTAVSPYKTKAEKRLYAAILKLGGNGISEYSVTKVDGKFVARGKAFLYGKVRHDDITVFMTQFPEEIETPDDPDSPSRETLFKSFEEALEKIKTGF